MLQEPKRGCRGVGEVGRDQTSWSQVGHAKTCGFYSNVVTGGVLRRQESDFHFQRLCWMSWEERNGGWDG